MCILFKYNILNAHVIFNIMLFGSHPNTLDLYHLFTNAEFALEYAKNINLIYNSIICDKCNHEMFITRINSFQYGQCFYCKCGNRRSILIGSYFMYSKIPINKDFHLIYCWANEFSCSTTIKETKICKNTVTLRFQQLREACLDYISEMNENHLIGGNGKIVEIDETCISHRKYNRGRLVKEVWVFGGICHEDGDVFAITVPDRTKETLIKELQKHVLPDTIIYSDCWKAYSDIDQYFKDHKQVNHSTNFVDPVTKCNTQRIERLWRDLKKIIKKYEGVPTDAINRYVGEYIWRRNEIKNKGIDPFYAILNLLIQTEFIPQN